jgi:HAD superfamily hydrolase (TIGR01509 family)
MPQSPWDAIILDLGNVVFEWSTESGVQPEATLKSMMRSDTYAQYETGQIETEDEFCSMLGEQLGLDSSLVRTTFETARQSLVANDELVDFIRELKRVTDIRVYAMSNIPRKEVDYLRREHPSTMSIFDRVYASGKAGLRKPDPAFYRMVLSDSQLAPERAIFVDDKMQNVQVARDLGMRGLRFESTKALCDSLSGTFDLE